MSACFYLIRHARAEATAPAGDQHRQLTPAGRDAFRETVASLAGRLEVRRIHASPVLRARQTGDLLSALTGAPLEEEEELSSGTCSGRQLLQLGRELGAGAALIGHNPEVAQAIALASGRDADVPPGTVAAIGLDGRLAWIARPDRSRR
jgi:phosphohistidine phosphatase